MISIRSFNINFYTLYNCSVFKQTLRSAGSNLTDKHIRDVSMSVLFLLNAAKKSDEVFGTSPQQSKHTTRDSAKDVEKMVTYMKEKTVSYEVEGRTGVIFNDPIEKGWNKIYNTPWIKDTLNRTTVVSNDGAVQDNEGDVDYSYELLDII